MAARKQQSAKPCKRLDLDLMTNAEVVAELERVYDSVLQRLNTHLEIAKDDDVDVETATVAVEQGIMLVVRVEALVTTFQRGWFEHCNRPCIAKWNWGYHDFRRDLHNAAYEVGRRGEIAGTVAS